MCSIGRLARVIRIGSKNLTRCVSPLAVGVAACAVTLVEHIDQPLLTIRLFVTNHPRTSERLMQIRQFIETVHRALQPSLSGRSSLWYRGCGRRNKVFFLLSTTEQEAQGYEETG